MIRPTRRRRTVLGVFAASAALTLAACAADPATTGGDDNANDPAASADTTYPMTISNCGADLVIDSQPETVFAIGTSAIALLDAAGASDRIVARAGEFGADLPAGLYDPPTDVPVIDPFDPTIENIVGVDPDVIVGYGLFSASDDDVAAAGIPNVIIDGECSHDAALTERTDFEAIFSDVERLADIFGTRTIAEERLAELRSEVESLTSSASADSAGESAVVVYYFSENASMSARGGQGIAHEVLRIAGFDNVYGDEPSVYLEASIETLLDADPHTIVIAYGLFGETFEQARDLLLAEPGASELTAVTEGRIVGVAANDLSPDPGAVRGLRTVLESTAVPAA